MQILNTFAATCLLLARMSAGCPDMEDPVCGVDEIMCPGEMDPEGCPMPSTCLPSFYNADVTDQYNIKCETLCPTICPEGEMVCGGGPDPWGVGCPIMTYCMPDSYPGTDGMTICPAYCFSDCGEDEIVCGGEMDAATGCLMPDYCMPATTPSATVEGEVCWNMCPVMCADDQVMCNDGTVDALGCPSIDYCAETCV